MYLIQYVNAYAALAALMNQEWDYQTAHDLVQLKAKLAPHAEFFAQEEMKLAREYAETSGDGEIILNERGNFTFLDSSRAPEYAKRRGELGTVEVENFQTPVRVKRPERIKPMHIEALAGFVEFGGEG